MREAARALDRRAAGRAVVGVAELRRITTGHSRGNWFLELDDGSRFVVRVEQGGVFGTVGRRRVRVHAGGRAGSGSRWRACAGWSRPATVIGQPFFVMDFIEGGVDDRARGPQPGARPGRRLRPPPRRAAPPRLERRARRADAERGDPRADRAVGRRVPIDVAADRSRCSRRARPGCTPTRRRSSAWRSSTAIPGPGNFVHDGHRVLALTDWEFSHLGDPTEDWSFLLSMRGSAHDAARGLAGADPARGRRRGRRRRRCATGGCSTSSRAPAPTAPACKPFAGVNPAPNMALIGTVLQQTFMRQMADLVAG